MHRPDCVSGHTHTMRLKYPHCLSWFHLRQKLSPLSGIICIKMANGFSPYNRQKLITTGKEQHDNCIDRHEWPEYNIQHIN